MQGVIVLTVKLFGETLKVPAHLSCLAWMNGSKTP
jgi:hypothetical protein